LVTYNFPKNLELFKATANKPFKGSLLIVPNYNGGLVQFKKHLRFYTSQGFNCYFLTLSHNRFPQLPPTQLSSQLKYGLRHLWVDEIEAALNFIPGPTLVVSHSFPSSSALMAIANRYGSGILGWVCEGGPFLNMVQSAWSLFTHGIPIKNIMLRSTLMTKSPVELGLLNYESDLKKSLMQLPANFPVLSIRGWRDKLVPPASIDKVFEGQNHLRYEILAITEGGHLDGLHKHGEQYKQRVTQFLDQLPDRQPLMSRDQN
jgi:hypothetical protein